MRPSFGTRQAPRLVSRKWDYANRRRPGRPSTAAAIRKLVIRMAKDNPAWFSASSSSSATRSLPPRCGRSCMPWGPAPRPAAPAGLEAVPDGAGTLRRELSGRALIVSEHHLRRVLTRYLRHYNTARPHCALGQFAPAQAHTRLPQINLAEHRIRRKQVLGGLTHEYQIAA
jgi:transposase InsO family protein